MKRAIRNLSPSLPSYSVIGGHDTWSCGSHFVIMWEDVINLLRVPEEKAGDTEVLGDTSDLTLDQPYSDFQQGNGYLHCLSLD